MPQKTQSQNLSLNSAEKQAFRFATFEDGIWEIFLGSTFLLMSIYDVTRSLLGPVINAILILGVIFSLVGLVWLVKKRLILPRVGMVRFGRRTKKKIRTANLITWGLVIMTFVIFILASKNILEEPTWGNLPQWVSDYDVDLFFALIIIAFFSAIGYSMDVPRFYLYGVILGIGNFVSAVMRVYNDFLFQWPNALAGFGIMLIGIYVLTRFLQGHPIPKEPRNA
jgi:hypothetical protein